MTDWSSLPPEEILLLLNSAAASGAPCSDFLDTHQYAPFLALPGVSLDGGHGLSQFRRACKDARPEVQVWRGSRVALAPEQRSVRAIRQLFKLAGVPAAALGDIILGREELLIFALPGLAVGQHLPGLTESTDSELPAQDSERLTVASLRADAVIAALFRVSRGEAQTAIEYGFIFRNFQPLLQRTVQIKAGDQLVYRSKGRLEMTAVEESSKSGRNWVSFRRFPA